ncbi:hypothetical protein Hdeb2414_s0008g00266301 [Helianthus debilis subsp. tardiflorus]
MTVIGGGFGLRFEGVWKKVGFDWVKVCNGEDEARRCGGFAGSPLKRTRKVTRRNAAVARFLFPSS